MDSEKRHDNMSDTDVEGLRKLPSFERKRNGQTAAFCTACGEEIKGVAYVVECRDAARLLSGAVSIFLLHYDCIAVTFKPARRS